MLSTRAFVETPTRVSKLEFYDNFVSKNSAQIQNKLFAQKIIAQLHERACAEPHSKPHSKSTHPRIQIQQEARAGQPDCQSDALTTRPRCLPKSKITKPFPQKSHECALKLTDLWITSLLFDLNYKFVNGSFAFSPG